MVGDTEMTDEKLQRKVNGIRPARLLDVRLAGRKLAKCRGCYRECLDSELDSEGWAACCRKLTREEYVPGSPEQGSY
jgi:hypothetical protein